MTDTALHIEYCTTQNLAPSDRRAILTVGDAAYEEDVTPLLRDCGPGLHALGRVSGALVTHALIVARELQVTGSAPLRTAYVELVATDPPQQRKGYASALLRALVSQMTEYDIAALSPSEESFYARFGWERWRGPLMVRTETGLESSPEDEEVMILRLPRTPAQLDLTAPVSVEWRPGEVW